MREIKTILDDVKGRLKSGYGISYDHALDLLFEEIAENEATWKGHINGLLETVEEICQDIRERTVKDYVCGLCEYDCDHGLDGNAFECPGFEKDNCFILRESFKEIYLKGE